MARLVEIIATSSSSHFLLLGWNADELANFKLMTYITKFGERAADWVQSLSLGYVSFLGGDVWKHNSNNVPRNNFYGEQKYAEVGIVANQEPNIVKLLDSIGIHSDGEWSIESVTIPKTLNYPHGMYSKIPKERFKKREGVFQSEFLRNMKSTSSVASVKEAISGEPLRGKSAYLVLRNTNTDQCKLFKIDIRMTNSR